MMPTEVVGLSAALFALALVFFHSTFAFAQQASQPAGGRGQGGGFREPEPRDFGDHTGYVSIFDGTTLKDWRQSRHLAC
jgi:hypothetical protein